MRPGRTHEDEIINTPSGRIGQAEFDEVIINQGVIHERSGVVVLPSVAAKCVALTGGRRSLFRQRSSPLP